jgi:hypothetical protein
METDETTWKNLYKVGAAALLTTAVLMPIQIVIFVVWPPPLEGTAMDWFNLFQSNKLIGLLSMDLLLIVDQVLLLPSFLALFVVLKRTSASAMALSLLLGLIGVAAYISSNTAFNMLSLSHQFAAATTESQRSTLLAAGEAILAIYDGTAFQLSYVLQALAGIITCTVMLRSQIFSKTTAYIGIAAGVIAFGLYVPKVGISISIFSVLFYEVWYILTARRLFQLAR